VKIAVVGAGGVGGFFGGLLVRGGADVHFLARGAQLEALRTSGLRISSTELGDVVISAVHATDRPEDIGPSDLVLICVKAHQTASVLDQIAPLVGPETTLVTLQNGLESDEVIAARFGAARVVVGVVYVGATLDAPGLITHVAAGTLTLGVRGGGALERAHSAATALRASGRAMTVVADIQRERWRKLVWNASFNPVSAITGRTPKDLLALPETRELIRGIMQEVTAGARADGSAIDEGAADDQIAFAERSAGVRTSMMVDRERGRQVEADALVGVVCRKGRRHGVATPLSDALYALLLAGE